jgi:ABC-type sugar transport system ATPase subunit
VHLAAKRVRRGLIGSPAMNLVPAAELDDGRSSVILGFRPEHVRVGPLPDGVGFDAGVEVVEYLGDDQLVHLVRNGTPLMAKLPVEERVRQGERLELSVPQAKLHRFDAETGARI